MSKKYDVCIVGSGAGAGPVIYELSKAGFKVAVLEKGPWYRTKDLTKDEITAVRRSVYTPNLEDEPQVLEEQTEDGNWEAESTFSSGNDFWNGSCVGGSSNFMSGYFFRMKPNDFQLHSKYGEIDGANIVDWPISYEDMEPWYTKVEEVVGISGNAKAHRFKEPRSTENFPYPPLVENIISEHLDKASERLGYEMIPTPRAILSQPRERRNACYYSNYCGSYGCSSDAKGSARVALVREALLSGNCTVIPNAKVFHLETDGNKKIVKANYYDAAGTRQSIEAGTFIVAAQAVETSRLLLMSKNKEFPNGLANNQGQVGKNLLFSAGGVGGGYLYARDFDKKTFEEFMRPGVFVNRSIHHFYEYEDEKSGKRIKGGAIDFLFEHANSMTRAIKQKWDNRDHLLYGTTYKKHLSSYFKDLRKIKFEVFADWTPTDQCYIQLDPKVKDKWGDPVARIRTGYHPHDIEVGRYLAKKGEAVLKQLGAKDIAWSVSGDPPSNLQAGGCRFGTDPKNSVLDPNCKAHEVKNLYVTDGSFMPTGGSVTYTWTIYANAFRVAAHLLEVLKRGN